MLRIADTLGGSVTHRREDHRTVFEVQLPVELVEAVADRLDPAELAAG